MATPNSKVMYGDGLIGSGVQGTIADTTTYRLRRGNGQWGAELGRLYQDKFSRVVPSSINNVNGEPYRAMLRAAVFHWQENVSPAEKAGYNRLAAKIQHLSGYNLFLSRAIKGEIEMYVDRGDPAAYDYAKEDLDLDGAWHDLDLSSIVPAGAKAVFIIGHVEGNGIDWTIMFRKKGNTNEVNHGGMETIRANVERHRSSIVALNTNRVIQYKADNQAWATLDLAVRGWWT